MSTDCAWAALSGFQEFLRHQAPFLCIAAPAADLDVANCWPRRDYLFSVMHGGPMALVAAAFMILLAAETYDPNTGNNRMAGCAALERATTTGNLPTAPEANLRAFGVL
jgi:hypothetical protein